MAKPARVGDLEVSQDLSIMRLEWKLERIGWMVMALLLLAALVGLLGPGPLSRATAGAANSSLRVDYNRFERNQSPAILRVHIGPQATRNGAARVWLKRDYVESIVLKHIDPEPQSVEVTPDRFIYTFLLSGGDRPATVSYHYEPNKMWRMPVRIGLDGGSALEFSQVFYP